MATRQSPSRESSVSRPPLSQRPSLSSLSNPDVFSDDFALSRGNSPDASPVDSIDSSSDNLPTHATSQPPPPRLSTAIPSSHLTTTNYPRPSSTSKRPLMFADGQSVAPHRAVSSISYSDADIRRSSSVSSHLSIPRAQSPYTGPTAPTQPYAMYPQVTRASSIASESTIRPVERPYVGTGGPEHPYGMYPQNTVEEEDDDDVRGPASTIPLGFPGMAQIYRGNQASGHDLGDIVGRDGHIEQLPPYTRYADNTIAKAASDDVSTPVDVTDIPQSLSPATSPTGDSDVNLTTAATRDAGDRSAEYNEKSKTSQRLRRKVCWGISLCVWLLVVAVIVIAATLGGVIGGVIGNNRAADAASDNTPTATTTVWLDAAPLPTGVPPPNCTPGVYNMPTTNTSIATNSCIMEAQYGDAWSCLQEEPVPFSIRYLNSNPVIELGKPGPGQVSGQGFNYGAQVPDLNNSVYSLAPSIDKDDPEAGGAMFVHVLYNKLTVVPAFVLTSHSKKSVKFTDLKERSIAPTPVSPGEMPYFCWFNQTLLELFIYSNLSTNATAANSTSYPYPYSTPAGSGGFSAAASTLMPVQTSSSENINQVSSPTTTPPPSPLSIDTYTPAWPTSYWPPAKRLARRGDGDNDDDDDNYPIYPKQIRLAEKRAPSGDDVTPYCIQMNVEDDWSVYPIEGTYVEIKEVEPDMPGSSRRWNRPRQANNNNNLDSDCACQWYST